MARITMIGAGSVVFASRLVTDILSWPELQSCSITLMDIDAGRLATAEAFTRRLIAQEKLAATVEATLDRRAALDGADYVVVMIQVGGLAMYEPDVQIPRRYGIDQTVGDTLGPGGVFRGLRTIPVLLDICQDMAELCPNALLINYSNPMAINCWAMEQLTSIRTLGLCHSVQGTAERLAGYCKIPYSQLSYWVAGINHQAWFLDLQWRRPDGELEDAYPLLRQSMDVPATLDQDPVRFEIMRHFDYFVTESSHHMSEYVPWFRKSPESVVRSLPKRWDYYEICKSREGTHYGAIRRQADGEEPIPFDRTHEYCAEIIHSIETDTPRRINGNVSNDGLIANLPSGCCVEVPCLVDGAGVHPCVVGDLPPQLAAINRTNVNVQELAFHAHVTGDRRYVYQAIQLDPLTSALLSLSQIRTMVDEMFAAESDWLPQFR